MRQFALIWDLETVPDMAAYRRLYGEELSDDELEEKLSGKFPKHVFHKIVCIGALIAQRSDTGWQIISRGAPHCGTRSEPELIRAFVDRIEDLHPLLVTFNGHSFDLPVLRYRAMIHKIQARGLMCEPYFKRYGGSAVDIMDELASFGPAKASLNELCRAMDLPGKASGVEGSQVHELFAAGRLQEISDYCVEDVTNTYRLWLRHELFCGRLTPEQFEIADQQAATS